MGKLVVAGMAVAGAGLLTAATYLQFGLYDAMMAGGIFLLLGAIIGGQLVWGDK